MSTVKDYGNRRISISIGKGIKKAWSPALSLASHLEAPGNAHPVETSNAEPHADMFIYITPQITPMLPLVQKEYTNG